MEYVISLFKIAQASREASQTDSSHIDIVTEIQSCYSSLSNIAFSSCWPESRCQKYILQSIRYGGRSYLTYQKHSRRGHHSKRTHVSKNVHGMTRQIGKSSKFSLFASCLRSTFVLLESASQKRVGNVKCYNLPVPNRHNVIFTYSYNLQKCRKNDTFVENRQHVTS